MAITLAGDADLIEELSSIEHERWAHWQKYLHSKAEKQSDGSLILPAHLVAHWEKQIITPYGLLSTDEKESDREQVRKYISVIDQWILKTKSGPR